MTPDDSATPDARDRLERLVRRLRLYNAWRRGLEIEQPSAHDVGKDIAAAAKEISGLLNALEFYRVRCELIQANQSKMRDPERTMVCDILANGKLLPDPNGSRYGS